MDPTDENTRDLLPAHDCNRSYLVCRPEGEQLLISPSPAAGKTSSCGCKPRVNCGADGRLEAKSELWFEGVNDDAYRNAFVK